MRPIPMFVNRNICRKTVNKCGAVSDIFFCADFELQFSGLQNIFLKLFDLLSIACMSRDWKNGIRRRLRLRGRSKFAWKSVYIGGVARTTRAHERRSLFTGGQLNIKKHAKAFARNAVC